MDFREFDKNTHFYYLYCKITTSLKSLQKYGFFDEVRDKKQKSKPNTHSPISSISFLDSSLTTHTQRVCAPITQFLIQNPMSHS